MNLWDTWTTGSNRPADPCFSILTVCEGNICRSPLAEQLLRAGLTEIQVPRATVSVSSAGLNAAVGEPTDERITVYSRSLGGVPDDHRSRQLSASIARSADLILTMTQSQRDSVVKFSPRKLRSTFSLGEFATLVRDYGVFSASRPDTSLLRTRVLEASAIRHNVKSVSELDVVDPYRGSDMLMRTVSSQIASYCQTIVAHFFI